MTLSNPFPSWGKDGESPPDNFEYEGEHQIQGKHINYLWNELHKLANDIIEAINDIQNIYSSEAVTHDDMQGGTSGNPHIDSASNTDVSNAVSEHETDGEHAQLDGDVVDRTESITALTGNVILVSKSDLDANGPGTYTTNSGDVVLAYDDS